MEWRPKKKGAIRRFSIASKLRRESRSNDEFEVMFNNLSLEEVIALKLELATKTIGGKLYGLPIWRILPNIAKDAALKYVYSASRTKLEAGRFLGLNPLQFTKELYRYRIEDYFKEQEEKGD